MHCMYKVTYNPSEPGRCRACLILLWHLTDRSDDDKTSEAAIGNSMQFKYGTLLETRWHRPALKELPCPVGKSNFVYNLDFAVLAVQATYHSQPCRLNIFPERVGASFLGYMYFFTLLL